ncbi:hypothetical protein Xmau_02088 [Xenorhabdus mauleonii]|uniref:Uncharacterized protein n=1 Tax=Xenorhabdus mauleonii TaxID=351675 RepID=A0A1I3HNR4_9GAMM|nr:hypothetical protein [Xenorhabdus mauleonii]PHM40327.1 hypothetical protein Xmau_02088 [Xenorhabdus mauleonii]SFI37408.1 hypothetical protein SAMN05421680_10110 [Xenorhabdus mauleonii]
MDEVYQNKDTDVTTFSAICCIGILNAIDDSEIGHVLDNAKDYLTSQDQSQGFFNYYIKAKEK